MYDLDVWDICRIALHYVETVRYSKEFKIMSKHEQERFKAYQKQISEMLKIHEDEMRNEV